MPLPKKLSRKASKAKKQQVVSETMHDLKHGPHHKDRTHRQEVAIAMKQSGQSKTASRKGGKKDKGALGKKKDSYGSNRKKRNIGRH